MSDTSAAACFPKPELFLSGRPVPPGVYRGVFTGKEIAGDGKNCLPCQKDGTPALYVRLTRPYHSADRITRAFAPSEGKLD